jgi:hypothetical protein
VTPDEIIRHLEESNPDALTADGFDEALIGIARRCGQPDLAVYDIDKCIQILVERDGMTEEQAREYLEFNSIGAWVGDSTPIWLER